MRPGGRVIKVRFAPKSRQVIASQRNDAKCHKLTRAAQQTARYSITKSASAISIKSGRSRLSRYRTIKTAW
jgi:hypothetical protein